MGLLTLVPTPIQDDHPLEPMAREALAHAAQDENSLILVEEHKVARGRWLRWGLPRETIDQFIIYNEHTRGEKKKEILQALKSGKSVFLLSDCGLPAFCDPGQELVDACHQSGIRVTATPFANSIALALALSGFPHERFVFSGFIPVKNPERQQWMKRELALPETMIWMETPYRLSKLLSELEALPTEREIFLACDLGAANELLLRGKVSGVAKHIALQDRKEFVLILGPKRR
jgi:16S rRNA (cytidine1402-2'-O)-methyltransferase